MNSEKITFQELPINDIGNDNLNIGTFINALKETIISTPTPYSLSIYGEWGSGKTSTLKILENIIVKSQDINYKTIWINAWELSLLSNKEELRKLFVAKILTSLFPSEFISNAFKGLITEAIKDIVGGVSLIQTNNIMKKLSQIQDEFNNKPIENKLHDGIKKAISVFNYGKIIIFIDDLDRISPDEVLIILDSIKVFFNVEGCFFILPLDHKRINEAISKKSQLSSINIYDLSYLDKAIQLNIVLPIQRYDIKKYITNLLNLDALPYKYKYFVDLYESLLINSIGRNPRIIKKICAIFKFYRKILITKLEKLKYFDDDSYWSAYFDNILFAMLCFQYSYPDIYEKLLSQNFITKSYLTNIINSINDNINVENYFCNHNEYETKKIINFLKILIKSIDQHGTNQILFSQEGIFLIGEISKIISDRCITPNNICENNKKMISIPLIVLEKYFNRIFQVYLEYFSQQICCEDTSNGLNVYFNYNCGPFSFNLELSLEGNFIVLSIKSGLSSDYLYKSMIKDWIEEKCYGLPDAHFNPSSEAFIKFSPIICDYFNVYQQNFIGKYLHIIKNILCSIFEPLSELQAKNNNTLCILENISSILIEKLQNSFPKNKGWIFFNKLSYTNRWSGIAIYHKSWNRKFYLCIEPQEYFMAKIIVGVKRSEWIYNSGNNYEEIFFNKVKKECKNMNIKSSKYWIIYNYPNMDSFIDISSSFISHLKLSSNYPDLIINNILSDILVYKSYFKDLCDLAIHIKS